MAVEQRITGFVLRRYWYLEKSLLIDWLTKERGRITASLRVKERYKIQDLSLLNGVVNGVGGILKVSNLELSKIYSVAKRNLWMVFYLNELLLKFLPVNEPEPLLFDAYQDTLSNLASSFEEAVIALRLFEKKILTILGYGFNFKDVTGQILVDDKRYRFIYKRGFVETKINSNYTFSGKSLLALANEQITENTLSEITRLLRYVLNLVLEGRLLRSSQIYREICHV